MESRTLLVGKFYHDKNDKVTDILTFIMKNSRALGQHEAAANHSHFSFQVQTEIHSVYLSFRFLSDSIDQDSLLTSAKGSRWWHGALRNTQNAIIIQCVWLLSESEWRINCSEMFNHRNFTTLSHLPPVKNTSIEKRTKKTKNPSLMKGYTSNQQSYPADTEAGGGGEKRGESMQ